jgi:hypothetical protein
MFQTAIPWYADEDYWWEIGYAPFQSLVKSLASHWVVQQSIDVVQKIHPKSLRQVIGGGLIVAGVLILIPGPAYVAVGAAGAYVGGPVGAAVGIGLYILLGIALIAIGYMLV